MLDLEEAVAKRCSLKEVFLAISQNSQENTCARDGITASAFVHFTHYFSNKNYCN